MNIRKGLSISVGTWCYQWLTPSGKWSRLQYAHPGCLLWLDGLQTIRIYDNRHNNNKEIVILPNAQSVRNAQALGFPVRLIRKKRTPPHPPRSSSLFD